MFCAVPEWFPNMSSKLAFYAVDQNFDALSVGRVAGNTVSHNILCF